MVKLLLWMGLLSLGCVSWCLGQTTYTWSSGGSTNFNNAANWTPGTGPPGAADHVVFDGTSSVDCEINSVKFVKSFSVNSGYKGNINVNANFFVNGDYTQDDGTVNLGAGSLITVGWLVSGSPTNFNVGTGGTFNSGTGTVTLTGDPTQTNTYSGALSFHDLIFECSYSISDDVTINNALILDTDVIPSPSIFLDLNGFTMFVNGNLTFNSDLKISRIDNGIVRVRGNIIELSNGIFAGDPLFPATYILDGTGDQNIDLNSGSIDILQIDKPSGNFTCDDLIISGSMEAVNLTGGTGSINNLQLHSDGFDPISLNLEPSSGPIIEVNSLEIGDVTALQDADLTIGGNLIVNGVLAINTASKLDLAGFTLETQSILDQNFLSTNGFFHSGGKVVLTGVNGLLVRFLGTLSFFDLEMNSPAAGVSYTQVNTNIEIINNLNLVNGILAIDAPLNTFSITLNSAASLTGASSDSFVATYTINDGGSIDEGFLIRQMGAADNFDFPVGALDLTDIFNPSSRYSGVIVENTSAAANVAVKYVMEEHANSGNLNPALDKVSAIEYFEVTPSASITANVTLLSRNINLSGITTCTDLHFSHYNTGVPEWEVLSPSTCNIAGLELTYKKDAVATFSDFTFGSTDLAANPLPIEILEFTATPLDSQVILKWSTASEKNNQYFAIMRSRDAKTFSEIKTVPGAGNSTEILHYEAIDENPLPGTSFYKLRQHDFDGAFVDLKVVKVEFESLEIYPNPTYNELIIDYQNRSYRKIEIVDTKGRAIRTYKGNLRNIDVSHLAPGIYFLRITGLHHKPMLRRFVKK